MLSSYVDGNQIMNSKYMMYSKDIDHYLINRPHQMIRHCLAKKNEAENMDTTGIRNLGNGMFFIKYYNNAAWKTYQVNFETMRVCRLAPATAEEHLHTLANTFLRYLKSFPSGAGTHYQVSAVTHHN